MVHRAVLGSLERFCGGLIEHYAGAFPVWLAPTQAMVFPIAERHEEYARGLYQQLRDSEIRAEYDSRSERINYRIREAQIQQVPYMLIVGDREAEQKEVSVRHRRDGDLGSMPFEQFLKRIEQEIKTKQL